MQTMQIYNNEGELVVDSSKNYYNTSKITSEDWSRIFGVSFTEARVYDNDGNLVDLKLARID